MAKVVLIGAKNPENWGWDENPVNCVEYKLEDIPRMYGAAFSEQFGNTDNFISSWIDDDWNKEYGKWILIDEKQAEESGLEGIVSFVQNSEMTYQEKFDMYFKLTKKELINLLIEANGQLDSISKNIQYITTTDIPPMK